MIDPRTSVGIYLLDKSWFRWQRIKDGGILSLCHASRTRTQPYSMAFHPWNSPHSGCEPAPRITERESGTVDQIFVVNFIAIGEGHLRISSEW